MHQPTTRIDKQSLALASIANIGGAEFAEALTPDVQVRG
jgi:hypothetical protein